MVSTLLKESTGVSTTVIAIFSGGGVHILFKILRGLRNLWSKVLNLRDPFQLPWVFHTLFLGQILNKSYLVFKLFVIYVMFVSDSVSKETLAV